MNQPITKHAGPHLGVGLPYNTSKKQQQQILTSLSADSNLAGDIGVIRGLTVFSFELFEAKSSCVDETLSEFLINVPILGLMTSVVAGIFTANESCVAISVAVERIVGETCFDREMVRCRSPLFLTTTDPMLILTVVVGCPTVNESLDGSR